MCCTSCEEVRAERDLWTSHFPGHEITRVSQKISPTMLFVASLSVCEESASVFQTPASVVGLPLSAFQGAGRGRGWRVEVVGWLQDQTARPLLS